MSNNRVEFLTPVGRLVSGDCFKGQSTDAEGRPLVFKSGPNQGQPRMNYFIGIAIPKTDQSFNELYAKMLGVARQGFPRLFDEAGNCILPTFSFKFEDGDSQIPNQNGIRNCDREGYPGNWILKMSSGFAPKCYTAGGAQLITDPEAIKRGYYIRVYGNIASNDSQQKPGILLNPNMVELVAFGDVIVSGPDGASIFGGTPVAQLPPGATTTPPAPATTIAQPGAPVTAPTAPVAAPGIPSAPQSTPVAPAAAPAISTPSPNLAPAQPAISGVSPAPDFLNPAPPAADPASTVEMFVVNGAKYSREQLRGHGWTDAQIDATRDNLPF